MTRYARRYATRNPTVEIEWEIEVDLDEDDYEVVTLHIEGSVEPYVPAKLSGPPEDCYPAEGGGAEIIKITGPDGKPWTGTLTAEDDIEEALCKAYEDECEAAAESAAEARYEARYDERW